VEGLGGYRVKVFTARLPEDQAPGHMDTCLLTGRACARHQIVDAIGDWTERQVGVRLEAINVKTHHMVELWDDRAVQVEPNTGRALMDEVLAEATALRGKP
jgi:hypothetical protein